MRAVQAAMGLRSCVGGCAPLFALAVVFDVVGVILLFVGIFANAQLGNLFYGDFLIYTGSLIIFLSLGFWVMWCVWNVPVPEDDGLKKRSSMVVKLARKLTDRLSQKLKGEEEVSLPPAKASRVTWGRSTAYTNEGYDASLEEKEVEHEGEENQAM